MPEAPASLAAAALLDALVGGGVTDVVVSPGSRSQALALAAAALETAGLVHLHVRIDERVAGFTAVGLARESGRPVAVVVTSGTAVAELHPAVLEAHHAGIPLLLLTADRPRELRGVGANQATAQPGIFGVATRAVVEVDAPGDDGAAQAVAAARRALTASVGDGRSAPGPVQIDLAYREPLSSAVRAPAALHVDPIVRPEAVGAPLLIEHGPRTVVIAGDLAGPVAADLAAAGGWPLLAEVSSGARFGPLVIGAYGPLLQDEQLGGRVERAIVLGHPTLSREVPLLLARRDVETVVVGPAGGEWFDPTGGRARRVHAVRVAPDEATPEARAWTGAWVAASRRILDATDDLPYGGDPANPGRRETRDHAKAELTAIRATVTRKALAAAVWRATWPHDRLVLAASRLIRVIDSTVPGKRVTVHANRGLAGIDGTVATATGVALASQREGRGATGTTRVVVGDVAMLHDSGALLGSPGEPEPRIQIVVGDDGGGTIFDDLEVRATADDAAFTRVMTTPRSVDWAALGAAYGWHVERVGSRGDLDRILTSPRPGRSLVIVPLAD